MKIFVVNWQELFMPTLSLAEIFIRGTIIYFSIFLFFRKSKKQLGNLAIPDLIVLVIIADASQNALAGGYRSITEGILLVGIIFFWENLLDWLAIRFILVCKFIHPDPVRIILNGKIETENMKKELITIAELESTLRQEGVKLEKVKEAFIEAGGHLSFILA